MAKTLRPPGTVHQASVDANGDKLYVVKYFLARGLAVDRSVDAFKRVVPTAVLAGILPALLFMTALFVRNLQPQQYEPAHTAQRIVAWYAARQWTLWGLLMALPLAVLIAGSATLAHRWRADAALRQAARETLPRLRTHLSTLLIAGATLAAAGVLAIVALHTMTS